MDDFYKSELSDAKKSHFEIGVILSEEKNFLTGFSMYLPLYYSYIC